MRVTDYVTAIEVVVLAVWIEVALTVMPFSRLLQRVRRLPSDIPPASQAPIDYQRLIRFVAVAYEILPFPTTCLRQSLVLYALLERRAVPSRLCLGVALNGAALDAHAWIECGGIASDATVARFSELHAVSRFARTSRLSRV